MKVKQLIQMLITISIVMGFIFFLNWFGGLCMIILAFALIFFIGALLFFAYEGAESLTSILIKKYNELVNRRKR